MHESSNLKIYSNKPRQHIVDLYLDKTVEGRVNGTKNVITRAYWVLMLTALAHSCLITRNRDGIDRWVCGERDINAGAAYLQIGTGTAPESFSQYNLATPGPTISTSIAFGTGTDRNRVSLTGAAPAAFNELGVFQPLFYDSTTPHYLFARKAISGSTGQAINYSFDFFDPWSYNTALMMFGVFRDANVDGAVDIGGTVFTLRTAGDFTESAARLVISETAESWTPTKTSITNPIELTTYYAILSAENIVYLILTGVIAPATSLTVRTIGLVQKLYGTDNIARNCLMLLQPLATPITFEANRTNMVQLRLIAL